MAESAMRPKLALAGTCLLMLLVSTGFYLFFSAPSRLASSPSAPRPWDEERFKMLTAPMASASSPLDPCHAASAGPLSPGKLGWETRIRMPEEDFVPDYEIVRFNARDAFKGRDFDGTVTWMGARTFSIREFNDPRDTRLRVFRPGGSELDAAGQAELGIGKSDADPIGGWGLETTSFRFCLKLDGCANPQARARAIFDSRTHVGLDQGCNAREIGGQIHAGASLKVHHDAPMLAVVDIAHGTTRDHVIPFRKGEVISDPEFQFKLLELDKGICYSVTTWHDPVEIRRRYDAPDPDPEHFLAIWEINPPILEAAVSLEVLDAAGEVIAEASRLVDLVPSSRFRGRLKDAVSLRVRYRPKQARLLVEFDGLPGVPAGNVAPTNLFDVRGPEVEFRDPHHMRHYLATFAQLQQGSSAAGAPVAGAFPMPMKNPTLREVAERYLALGDERRIKVDPKAMTIEFEQDPTPNRIVEWLRGKGLWKGP